MLALQTWTILFRQDGTFETEENAFRLSYTLNSVDLIQDIAVRRSVVDLDKLNELLSSGRSSYGFSTYQ
jgi:hypothetical protein